MEGNIEGKAPRGRPGNKYLGQVKKDTGKKSFREVKEHGIRRNRGLQYTNPKIVIL
jgi:hypothetical protein